MYISDTFKPILNNCQLSNIISKSIQMILMQNEANSKHKIHLKIRCGAVQFFLSAVLFFQKKYTKFAPMSKNNIKKINGICVW